MRLHFIFYLVLFLFCTTLKAQNNPKSVEYSKAGFFQIPNSGRDVYDFNVGWRFYKGDVKNAELTTFDDSNWDVISTPHGLELNSTQASGSNNYQGEAWYRKHFTIPDSIKNKRLNIHFEAVMGKCKIWLNGELLKTHFGGYLPFSVDITDKVIKDKKNVIVIWTDNSDDPTYPPGKPQKVLDFSYFGGIYRDVWLITTNDIYITNPNNVDKVAGGGVFVHYEKLSNESVNIVIQTDIANKKSSKNNFSISYTLKDSKGIKVVEKKKDTTISAHTSQQYKTTLSLKNPNLWSPKNPYQYQLEIVVLNDKNEKIDGVRQKLGIRKIEFKGKDGFFLNNKPYHGKLMGANRHQDFAYVGNALPNSGQWRDALLLKDAGCEIIRAAHYPADPAFMDACDALGMFFIVATPGWQFWNDDNPSFEKFVYQDIREMVRRDRNYASVLLWEPILNETHYPSYFAEKVHNLVHEEYPFQGAYTACDSRAFGMEYFDVIYDHPRYADKFKVWIPDPKGAEVSEIKFDYSDEKRSIFTREWGDNVDDWNSHNSTSRVARGWGEAAQLIQANHYANTKYRFTNWESISSTPTQHIGGALWHSFDHQRGYHPDPFYGGITDVFRQPKYSYYLFKAQLKPEHSEPMIYIAHEMSPFSSSDVTVITNCDEVRLTVLEKDTITLKQDKKLNMNSPMLLFKDVFDYMDIKRLYRSKKHKEASIVAEGIIDGKVVVTSKKIPSNRKTKIKLELANNGIPLTANGSDFVTIIASIVDNNGSIKRLSQDYIKFEVEGEGRIIGDATIMANPKQTEWGTAPVLIQSTSKIGEIKVIASVIEEGIHTPVFGELTFTSIAPITPLLFNENTGISSKKAKSKNMNDATDNVSKESLKRKIKKMEKIINDYKLIEVQKQQEEFEGAMKKKKD